MTRDVLLITEKELKDSSMLEQNVDVKTLSLMAKNVQRLQVQPILGNDLYEQVLEAAYQKAVNNTEMDAQVKELIFDYIKPYLLHATVAEFIVINHFKLTNKGALKLTDATAQPAGVNELEYLKNYYDNYAAVYKSRLIEYLKDNQLTKGETDTNATSESIGWYLN